MQSGFQSWPLPSGVWRHDDASDAWTLQRTAQGRPRSSQVTAADAAQLSAGAQAAGAPDRIFPPEFRFDPATGASLVVPTPPQREPWCPPYGDEAARADDTEVRGLRRTGVALALRRRHDSTEDAPISLPLPPPGAYEFVVGRFGSAHDTLLAYEPDHGSLLAWLPRSAGWLPLRGPAGSVLAEFGLSREHWGLELTQGGAFAQAAALTPSGALTRLFVPTTAGLALIEPDVLAAAYGLQRVGDAPVIGAPLAWADAVWAPCKRSATTVELISVSLAGVPGPSLRLELPVTLPDDGFAPPVCTPRQLVWPCREGQLLLRLGSGGAPEASWLAWPAGVVPAFEFGSPYLSRTGALWQLAFDENADAYAYVQLGRANPERQPVSAPRFCTGMLSYRLGQRLEGDPWLDPEHAFDAGSHEVVVPLLESERHDAALGLVVEAPAGVGELMRSRERKRAVLQLQSDQHTDARFFTLNAALPWRCRAFVFAGCLWLFHPELGRIAGWELERST